jgi:fructose-1-phosphate kinase PfkB-like protein
VRRLHAVVERLEPVSKVGSGDTLLAGFLAARAQGKQVDEALRLGVAAGMASTLELGAGRFDPREVTRLAAAVKLNELAAATA